MTDTSGLDHLPCPYCAMLSRCAAGYWKLLSPLVHSAGPHEALVSTLTVLFVVAQGYLRGGSLTFHVIV